MIKGLLFYDKCDREHNSWFINKIITEGAKENMHIDLVLTEDFKENYAFKDCQFAIMRNRNAEIAALLEAAGIRCFNSSAVIRLGNDKWAMYEYLKDKNIPLMHTQRTKLPYPFVFKARHGHGGSEVFMINDSADYERVKRASGGDYIFQLKASQTGRDIRVYILGNRIVTAMERTSDTDFRANFSLGAKACEYALTSDEMVLASRVAELIKPDFIGVDIIYNNGRPVLNEIEDAVGTRMLYEYTDIDAALEYILYIKGCLSA